MRLLPAYGSDGKPHLVDADETKGPVPLYEPVEGSPYQPGDTVTVAKVLDDETVEEPERYIGASGVVVYLEYSCGCGQSYPADPMIAVNFPDLPQEEFWAEELNPVRMPPCGV